MQKHAERTDKRPPIGAALGKILYSVISGYIRAGTRFARVRRPKRPETEGTRSVR